MIEDRPAAPRYPRTPGRKTHINCPLLFNEIDANADHNISRVAAKYRDVNRHTLLRRYKAHKDALTVNDQVMKEIAEQKIDGPTFSRATLGREGDDKLWMIMWQKKENDEPVNRDVILSEVTTSITKFTPHPTRYQPPFPSSAQFFTWLGHRYGLPPDRQHKIKRTKKMTEEKENQLLGDMVEFNVKWRRRSRNTVSR